MVRRDEYHVLLHGDSIAFQDAMDCKACQDLLSDYLDGTVSRRDADDITRHLAECRVCATVHADLLRLVAAADAIDPRRGGPSLTAPRAPRRVGLFRRYVEIRLTIPQFAAAIAVFTGTLVMMGWMLLHPPATGPNPLLTRVALPTEARLVAMGDAAPRPERAVLEESIARLSRSLDRRRENWNPELRRVFERNMAIIDQSLAECEQVLRRNPRDVDAEEMLLAAYREKLRVLQEFAAI